MKVTLCRLRFRPPILPLIGPLLAATARAADLRSLLDSRSTAADDIPVCKRAVIPSSTTPTCFAPVRAISTTAVTLSNNRQHYYNSKGERSSGNSNNTAGSHWRNYSNNQSSLCSSSQQLTPPPLTDPLPQLSPFQAPQPSLSSLRTMQICASNPHSTVASRTHVNAARSAPAVLSMVNTTSRLHL